jgi:hypothetical protein
MTSRCSGELETAVSFSIEAGMLWSDSAVCGGAMFTSTSHCGIGVAQKGLYTVDSRLIDSCQRGQRRIYAFDPPSHPGG